MRAPSTRAAPVVALVLLAGGATAQLTSTLSCARPCLTGTCATYSNMMDCDAMRGVGCDCDGCCMAGPTAAPTMSDAACKRQCLASTCSTYLGMMSCAQSAGVGCDCNGCCHEDPSQVTPTVAPPGLRAAAATSITGTVCTNQCEFSHDNDCDDGGEGNEHTCSGGQGCCELGTDCADCGARQVVPEAAALLRAGLGPTTPTLTMPTLPVQPTIPGMTGGLLCSDTCQFANDMGCDDGGEGSEHTCNNGQTCCDLGTDCADCGKRVPAPGPTAAPTSAPTFGIGIDACNEHCFDGVTCKQLIDHGMTCAALDAAGCDVCTKCSMCYLQPPQG